MSKQGKRKITVELPKAKDLLNRPSVFERLGTKKNSSAKKTIEHCRQWGQNGSCAYGKSCKFSSTHTLISPSKQRAAKDSDLKRIDDNKRLLSTVVVRSGRGSPDGDIENWDQNDLEYADTDVLEKRRLQLQRELELQLKMDSGKDMRKDKKKAVTSSSSSRSSSSSSVSSSSSDGSSSSSSSGRDLKRKGRKKIKRNSSSSSEGDVPSKRKFQKSDIKRDKSDAKKGSVKKDDKLLKKTDASKKKSVTKTVLGKKSLSPGKKSGGTPPITSKSVTKTVKHGKSPLRRDKNRSASPRSARDRDRNKERDKERERERMRGRSRSPKKGRSRSPRRLGSNSKDTKRKASSERSRPVSPKKQTRKEGSSDRNRKRSPSRDRERARDHKDRSLERRKDKHDEKDRHDRKDNRGRNKDSNKRDDKRRGRGGGGGLGRGGGADKGLEKPSKPMERLLPRPEERLAALAAISNRVLESDKNSTTSKDNPSERGGRKQDRLERDRTGKRDRMDSIEREQGDYEMGLDRQYERDRSIERYEGGPREDDRSPGYGMSSRDRHYDPGYDISGPQRGYQEDDDRMYNEHMSGQRGDHAGYDDRRPLRDRSWEGRAGSLDRERGNYIHPHKDWDNDDYRSGGDWGRDRHWPIHDPQMGEWGDKEDLDGWHHRGHPGGPHRGRMNENFGRGLHGGGNKRRAPRVEQEPPAKKSPAQTAPAPSTSQEADVDDKPIPDDLSEISDDPDDILNREDMVDQTMDDESQNENLNDESAKVESSEKESTQDTSGLAEDKESQDAKDDEDVANLDFEEISDGELEEERTRAGLGDALGVDWASLVADVRRREQTATSTGGARDRWRPERVLPRIGLSVEMAGKTMVQEILRKNALSLQEQSEERKEENDKPKHNGSHEPESEGVVSPPDVASIHPVAAIQVAIEKRKQQRSVLFGSGCEITRGLSARRDLALRRYLCNLPAVERTGQNRVSPQPSLFHAARALLMQSPVSG